MYTLDVMVHGFMWTAIGTWYTLRLHLIYTIGHFSAHAHQHGDVYIRSASPQTGSQIGNKDNTMTDKKPLPCFDCRTADACLHRGTCLAALMREKRRVSPA